MGLQIWLPMNGNLNNQGLDNGNIITNNNATINANGKIGSCYEFNGSSSYLIGTTSSFSNNTLDWSYACWFKPKNSHTGCLFSCRTSASESGITIFYYNGNFYIDDGVRWNFTPQTTLVANTWYHLAVVRMKGVGKFFYINGILDRSTTTTGNPSIVSTTNYSIGASQQNATTASGNFLNGYLNDVRVYNHALSASEIKRISMGLVLHYPLSSEGFGQDNLVTNSSTFKVGTHSTKITTSVNEDGTYQVISESGNGNWNSSWYDTLSGIEDSFSDGDQFTISFVMKSSDGTRPPTIYIKPGMGYWSMSGKISSSWSTVYYTGTWVKNGTLQPHLGWSSAIGTYQIKSWKLEKGAIATPWIPSSADAKYTSLGLNSDVVYDISGFNYNGVKNGTFKYGSNTPKMWVSTEFNGTNNAITIPFNSALGTSQRDYTVSVWIYKTSIGSKGYQTILGGPSGFELEARNAAGTDPVFVGWNWGKPTAPYEFNQWTLFTFVHTTTDCKIYVNGQYVSTGTSKSNPSGNYYIGAWSSATGQNYQGLMSDFRIYATALSADDILELYKTPSYLASNAS